MTADDRAQMEPGFVLESLGPDCGMRFRAGTLLERVQSPYQLIEVYATPLWGTLLRLDSCNMTSEKDEFIYHENLVHPAALAHPAPRQALVIGGGDGGAAEELLKHPSVEQVTLVELDRMVVDAAKKYFAAVHRGVFDHPRLQLRIGDGVEFLRESEARFDLIVLDLTDPTGPSAELYTPAMFAACKRALRPGGVASLHIGSPFFQPQRFRRIFDDLAGVFRVVRPCLAYVPTYGAPWSLVTASDTLDPRARTAAEVDTGIAERGLRDLQYLCGATHAAGFALPEFIAALLR